MKLFVNPLRFQKPYIQFFRYNILDVKIYVKGQIVTLHMCLQLKSLLNIFLNNNIISRHIQRKKVNEDYMLLF